jgi:Flp pilus assembly secretin CpaC
VMLALRDEADSYAPTLLEVAKLAFRRPLISLGLVGIMESRSALRQRIERLVDFRAPRKAGMTFASVCGIFVFSAVALPMGEGPAPAETQTANSAVAATEEQTLTVTVNPEIFLRNVKAQAPKTLLSRTNDYAVILLDLLRSEGLDCNPPHGLAFNNLTGEITTQNTPDKLEIFRLVIEQLNRPDGKCELPLRGFKFRRKMVVIEGQIFQMRATEFGGIISGLKLYQTGGGDPWWSASPEEFHELTRHLASSGWQAIQRPRIQTSSGTLAQFFVGTTFVGKDPEGIEFDCKPIVEDGFVDLTVQGRMVNPNPGKNAFTNQFHASASALDHGGLVLRIENFDGHTASNLVVVIGVQIITNTQPEHLQQRLVPLGKSASTSPPGQAQELVQDGKLLYEMGKLDEAEAKLSEAAKSDPENASASYYLNLVRQAKAARGSQTIGKSTGSNSLVYTGPGRQAIVAKLREIRLDQFSTGDAAMPLSQVLKHLAEQVRLRDPQRNGINFLVNNNPPQSGPPRSAGPVAAIDPATGLPVQTDGGSSARSLDLGSLPIAINPPMENVTLEAALDAVVKASPTPIRYSVQDFAVVISTPEPAKLFTRVFRINPGSFFDSLKSPEGPMTNGAANPTQRFFEKFGLDGTSPPGKVVFFKEGGYVFVKATMPDLDSIERAFQQADQSSAATNFQNSTPKRLTDTNGLLTDSNYRAALRALEQRSGVASLSEPEATTTSGRGINRIAMTNFSVLMHNTNAAVNTMTKLDHIRLEKFSTGDAGQPLREVLAQLNGESKFRDPERKGIDFVINSGGTNAAAPEDVGGLIIKIPGLKDVRLADVLDAIVLVAEHPIKYSIRDSDVIFSAKSSEVPQLFMRTFRVDPNTFYSGLENVSTQSFGSFPKSSSGMEIGDGPDWSPSNPVYVTTQTSATTPSMLARKFFTSLGIDLQNPPGKSVFYGDRLGVLFVKATEADLDTIERAIQMLNTPPPQLHIKARFYEVPKGTLAGLGISLTSSSQAVGQVTAVLTNPNFRTALQALEQHAGVETLGEPEATMLSGRQTQMRATTIITVVTNLVLQNNTNNGPGSMAIVPQTGQVETGPILDVVPYVLADGYTINLALIPSVTEFLGYEAATNSNNVHHGQINTMDLPTGDTISLPATSLATAIPTPRPVFSSRQSVATVNLWDGQTVLLGGMSMKKFTTGGSPQFGQLFQGKNANPTTNEILVFITATIVDPAGNRVHADDELPFAQNAVPTQPVKK